MLLGQRPQRRGEIAGGDRNLIATTNTPRSGISRSGSPRPRPPGRPDTGPARGPRRPGSAKSPDGGQRRLKPGSDRCRVDRRPAPDSSRRDPRSTVRETDGFTDRGDGDAGRHNGAYPVRTRVRVASTLAQRSPVMHARVTEAHRRRLCPCTSPKRPTGTSWPGCPSAPAANSPTGSRNRGRSGLLPVRGSGLLAPGRAQPRTRGTPSPSSAEHDRRRHAPGGVKLIPARGRRAAVPPSKTPATLTTRRPLSTPRIRADPRIRAYAKVAVPEGAPPLRTSGRHAAPRQSRRIDSRRSTSR